MFCPNCGNNIADGSKFCNNCGNNLQPAPAGQNFVQQPAQQSQFAPQPAPQPYAQPAYGGVATRPNPNTKKIVIIAAVIVALIAGAWFMFFSGDDPHESPEAAFEAYISALNNRDAQALCDISLDKAISPKTGENVTASNYYRTIDEFNSKWGSDTKVTVEIERVGLARNCTESIRASGYGEEAKLLVYNIKAKNSDATYEEERVFIYKVDGKWYVDIKILLLLIDISLL